MSISSYSSRFFFFYIFVNIRHLAPVHLESLSSRWCCLVCHISSWTRLSVNRLLAGEFAPGPSVAVPHSGSVSPFLLFTFYHTSENAIITSAVFDWFSLKGEREREILALFFNIGATCWPTFLLHFDSRPCEITQPPSLNHRHHLFRNALIERIFTRQFSTSFLNLLSSMQSELRCWIQALHQKDVNGILYRYFSLSNVL